jgi:enterochelin esterase family protein
MEAKLISPKLIQLREAIEKGSTSELNTFWKQVETEGAPIIEPDGEDPNFSLVTFLWRGDKETSSVLLQASIDGSGENEHPMTRLLETDAWYISIRLRNDYRGVYKYLLYNSLGTEEAIEKHDPYNPKTFIEPKDEERPDHSEDDVDSILILSDANAHSWTETRKGVKTGDVTQHLFRSEILENERRVWIYTPSDYNKANNPYNYMIVLDGRFFKFAIKLTTILDNLIADGQVPPLVTIMVDNPGRTWQESMEYRDKEYSCYPPFTNFLSQELVPWLHQSYHLSDVPMDIFLMGGSAGGLAAIYTTLEHPNTFGNAISLSGSFWWRPENDEEWEWLSRQFAKQDFTPTRFYIEVGLLESKPSSTGFPGQVLSNRHLRNVLKAKGYEVHYDEQMHGHDSMAWQIALPESLIALTQSSNSSL